MESSLMSSLVSSMKLTNSTDTNQPNEPHIDPGSQNNETEGKTSSMALTSSPDTDQPNQPHLDPGSENKEIEGVMSSLVSPMALTNGTEIDQPNEPQLDPGSGDKEIGGIRDVWKHNLYEEFAVMRKLVKTYNYIAMDTEFPGIVSRPLGDFKSRSHYQYQLMRANVDILKIIQLGLTLMNEQGHTPPGTSTWQFNFQYSIANDIYSKESLDLLINAGIQFPKHDTDGIDPYVFSELLISSGFVLTESVVWVSFHGCFDFAYLLKILMNAKLPETETAFFDLLRIFFQNTYDVKYLMRGCRNLRGGLQEVADNLNIERVGLRHQAGSDSLVTGLTFFKMKELYFDNKIDEFIYSGQLYGLDLSFTVPSENEVVPDSSPGSSQSCRQQ